jgi:hypothetical protein
MICLLVLWGGTVNFIRIVENQNHSQLLVFYKSILICSKEMATELMVYSYKHGFSGFAAKLTESQAQKVSGSCSNKHYFLFHAFMFPHFILMQSRLSRLCSSAGKP